MDLLAPTEGETIATLPAQGDAPALRYRVWSEPSSPPRATLAVLSGVMSNTAWFRPVADLWRGMGYRVLGLERRGSGLNHAVDMGCEDTPSAEVLIDDACRELEAARAPGRPLVVVGWCWGAILAVHVALRLQADPSGAHGGPAAGLALLTPGIYPSAAVGERMRALAEQATGSAPGEAVLDSPITDDMFTEGPALEAFIRRDASRWQRFSPRFLEVSTRLSLAARLRLRKIAHPLFVAFAEHDVTTDNDAFVAELARLPAEQVRTAFLPGPHGLQFEAPRELAERLDGWARDALGV